MSFLDITQSLVSNYYTVVTFTMASLVKKEVLYSTPSPLDAPRCPLRETNFTFYINSLRAYLLIILPKEEEEVQDMTLALC
jgi:hypothetical protein